MASRQKTIMDELKKDNDATKAELKATQDQLAALMQSLEELKRDQVAAATAATAAATVATPPPPPPPPGSPPMASLLPPGTDQLPTTIGATLRLLAAIYAAVVKERDEGSSTNAAGASADLTDPQTLRVDPTLSTTVSICNEILASKDRLDPTTKKIIDAFAITPTYANISDWSKFSQPPSNSSLISAKITKWKKQASATGSPVARIVTTLMDTQLLPSQFVLIDLKNPKNGVPVPEIKAMLTKIAEGDDGLSVEEKKDLETLDAIDLPAWASSVVTTFSVWMSTYSVTTWKGNNLLLDGLVRFAGALPLQLFNLNRALVGRILVTGRGAELFTCTEEANTSGTVWTDTASKLKVSIVDIKKDFKLELLPSEAQTSVHSLLEYLKKCRTNGNPDGCYSVPQEFASMVTATFEAINNEENCSLSNMLSRFSNQLADFLGKQAAHLGTSRESLLLSLMELGLAKLCFQRSDWPEPNFKGILRAHLKASYTGSFSLQTLAENIKDSVEADGVFVPEVHRQLSSELSAWFETTKLDYWVNLMNNRSLATTPTTLSVADNDTSHSGGKKRTNDELGDSSHGSTAKPKKSHVNPEFATFGRFTGHQVLSAALPENLVLSVHASTSKETDQGQVYHYITARSMQKLYEAYKDIPGVAFKGYCTNCALVVNTTNGAKASSHRCPVSMRSHKATVDFAKSTVSVEDAAKSLSIVPLDETSPLASGYKARFNAVGISNVSKCFGAVPASVNIGEVVKQSARH